MQYKKHTSAFTLIELLVVVLIIGILAAIALPQYQTTVDKSRYSTMMAATRAIKNAREIFYLQNGVYTNDLHDLEGTLPANCQIISNTSATCDLFYITINNNQTYAGLRKGVDNVFLLNIKEDAPSCYAYSASGERGRRLCKSLGTQKSTSVNADCGGSCTIYKI